MKQLKDYLNEGLLSRKVSIKTPIKYSPETKVELIKIITKLLKKGITDLNCIDVSKITDMRALFNRVKLKVKVSEIDISEWDVSNVEDMSYMFYDCNEFNANLSKWDVSNVNAVYSMFYGCEKFDSDLSKWNVSKVTVMPRMFEGCKIFNSDLSKWNVSEVTSTEHMFDGCKKFNSDLSKWNVSNLTNMFGMFDGCIALKKNNNIPAWYKDK